MARAESSSMEEMARTVTSTLSQGKSMLIRITSPSPSLVYHVKVLLHAAVSPDVRWIEA